VFTGRRVGEALEVVRLSDLARRRPRQLSGGQQQRVALARALVNRPAALLLDEPLAALDPNLRRAMQLELKRIQREVGITFLFVTHDREEALALSDRLAVMQGGRIAQVGSPRQLYDQPLSPDVATFLGSANLLPDGAGGWQLLRPERLRLRQVPPAGGERGVRARLESITFQGPTLEVRLRPLDPLDLPAAAADRAAVATAEPPGSAALVALATRDNLPSDLTPCCRLWCVWDPADTHPLSGAPSGSARPGGRELPSS
jgi:spermidine/putrescine transport system ATP-binding protein